MIDLTDSMECHLTVTIKFMRNPTMFARPSVVIDNGSYCCKAGFSCDNHPVAIFRNVVGRPKNRIGFYGREPYDVYIGDDAMSMIQDYELHSPVEQGRIVHWDNMERVWHHIFYRELKVAPEAQNVVVALATSTSLEDKVKCCEIFFENLNAPAICLQAQSVAAIYGAGFTTGICVDLGYASTNIHAMYEGGTMSFAHVDTNLCGHDITMYIQKRLEDRGIVLGDYGPSVATDIKRNFMQIQKECYECDLKVAYTLPDGKVINISQIVHCVPELIFNPKAILGEDTNVMPLHEAVIQSVHKCDADLHEELYGAVVPTGGLSATPGLPKRLQHEMELALHREVNVVESSEMYCLNWLGAAVYAGMKDSDKIWLKKKQFEEHGIKIVKNKFT